LAQKLVFAHGKPVAVWQGLHMGGSHKKASFARIVRPKSSKSLKILELRQIKGF
jgi:hypothetical protein